MTRSLLLAPLVLALLAACQPASDPAAAPADTAAAPPAPDAAEPAPPPPAADTRTYRFQCGDKAIEATFDQGDGPVVLAYDGKTLSLPHVESASGARYADEAGNELWTRGSTEGLLTLAGEAERTCTALAPEAPPAPTAPAAPSAAAVGDNYPVARDACVAAVAAVTGADASRLVVTDVLWAEAGVGVTISVPGAQAPWACLSDEKGNVQGTSYTGSEGAA